jgi:NitT/TauT family transport system ATP-binding protein
MDLWHFRSMEVVMSIQLIDVTKKYDNLTVLNHINLEIKENKITCIMGPSGCGKTTLLHILLGLVTKDSGDIKGLNNKIISAVFQENRLCEGFYAIKNVQIVCDRHMTTDMIKNEFMDVGLVDYENKPVSELSGGMKRRVAIVRALIARSDVIIMDEPFKGLNDEIKDQVMGYVKRKTLGKTVIIVTHDKLEVEALSADLIRL